jgi:hypothetical protein
MIMSDDPNIRLEQAFEECRKVFEEFDDLVRRIRELIIEDKTVSEQLLKLLDEKYFSKLNEVESKLTKAEKKFETVITKSK